MKRVSHETIEKFVEEVSIMREKQKANEKRKCQENETAARFYEHFVDELLEKIVQKQEQQEDTEDE